MSCSGQHFSIHSPDCKAHMSIQSNKPIQVESLTSNSRITTPISTQQSPTRSSGAEAQVQYLSNQATTSFSPSVLQIQTLMESDGGGGGGHCGRLEGVISPMAKSPLVGQHESGDGNYTLVILDCSPHSMQQASSLQENSVSCESNHCRNCLNGCHCQTELIVRQQIEHDHSCQHHDHQRALSSSSAASFARSGRDQVTEGHHFGVGSSPADGWASQTTTMTSTSFTAEPKQRRQQEIGNQQQSSQYQKPGDGQHQHAAIDYGDKQFNGESQRFGGWQQQESTTQTFESNSRNSTSRWNNEKFQEDFPNQRKQQHPQQQQQQQPKQHQQQQRKAREGMRIVKRWNWNQAQFIEEEVPDQPSPRPSPRPPQQQQAQSHQPTDLWNQEIKDIYLSLSPMPSEQQQHFDPSWLAYRKPDEESVQADPLYRDLMLELQRLEEGVQSRQVQPEPIITPECTQRPVFGQPIQPESVELEEHDNVEFIARLIPNSDASMQIEWTKNGQPLMESSRLTCEYEFGVVRLAIRRCEAEDSGVYQCRATNQLGEAVSSTKLLVHAKNCVQYDTLHPAGLDKIRQLENPPQVEYPEEAPLQQAPKFLTHIQDYVEKDEGDSVHFECNLAPVDDPDIKTEWFFNGRPLVTGSRFHTIDDFGFIVLDIDWLFPRDTGEYICRATNKHGTSFTRTVLRVRPAKNIILDSQLDNADATINKLHKLEFPDVQEESHVVESQKPAHFVRPLRVTPDDSRRHFVEGDQVCFEAEAGPASDGQLSVEWFHDGRPLLSGHRFKPNFDFGHIQLELLYVYPEDSGVYKCVARNGQGQAESQVEIHVQGKQSIVYQSQLPREMQGGVEKITEMEAMWNRPPDPEEEEAPAERLAPQFVLKPKPCQAFEGSCARFCCRILAHPRPRVAWFINEQLVVSGARYKLTHDGMYHLIIPKCSLQDAGRVEVRAKNLLGECRSETQLVVKRKVDDYRGVLKNSPNPWYDEQTLKLYRRTRNHEDDEQENEDDEEDFDEFLANFQRQQRQQQQLKIATQLQTTSPTSGHQLIGYTEPETPDVNLLATSSQRSPLVEPGDLHPVVMEQQVIHAPAPSTIKRALEDTAAEAATAADEALNRVEYAQRQANSNKDLKLQEGGGGGGGDKQVRQVFGLNNQRGQQQTQQQIKISNAAKQSHLHQMPRASPENVEHGKEIHSHFHSQLQVERRPNKEITREIIEKETFEQEHKGLTRDNLTSVLAASGTSASQQEVRRGVTPTRAELPESYGRRTQSSSAGGQTLDSQQVVTMSRTSAMTSGDEFLVPPEFLIKLQPCQAIEGDEARFECEFRGEPKPQISWFCDNKPLRASNLYSIETDLEGNKSALVIKRVTAAQANAVYTVKADNAAGSAKSSANLVVEAHPVPRMGSRGGHARQFDALDHLEQSGGGGGGGTRQLFSDVRGFASPTASDYDESSLQGELASVASRNSSVASGLKVVKSVRRRRLSPDELSSLMRASPDNQVAPTFLHTIHEVHAKLGDLARLDARLVGGQPMEVRWLKDGQRVRAGKQHKLLLEGDLYTLLILECGAHDEGFYECLAENSVGEARCGAMLRVSVDGRNSTAGMSQSFMTAASSGQSVSGWTSTSTAKSMATSGASAGQSSASMRSSEINRTSGGDGGATRQHQLVPDAGQRQHFGLTKQPHHQLMSEYTPAEDLNASQAGGIWHTRQSLSPGGAAAATPKLIKGLENQQVVEGKSVTLRCQISAHPKAEIAWFRRGSSASEDKQIKPSKYFRIFKDNDETHCLKILETFPEDQGEYKCVARAQNGLTETRAFISVLPNSPR